MKPLWSRRIAGAQPYTPGEQPRGRTFIKLNTNELPYPPSPRVLDALRGAADDALRLYPDPACTALREAIAARFGLTPAQVFCGNGSDEILAFAFQAFFDSEPGVIFPDVTYSFYPVYARFFGLNFIEAPTGEGFTLPIDALASFSGGVVIANPNAPTGMAIGESDLRRVLDASRNRVVIVDEAYVDFGGQSAVGLIDEYPNLLVVQTMSKSRALAGLRVGWAMGHPDLIDGLCCVRDCVNSYTLDRPAQAGAAAAIGDDDYFRATVARVIKTREETAERLSGMGFTVLPSCTNFLFVTHPARSAEELLAGLRAAGILVRRFAAQPRIANYLRISIGTDEEMTALCEALMHLLS